ncbi:MAG: ABC transporter substrate-binding protein [Solirubrobacterales bacterium]|nr:ABC transporter substrate-binding protein [Solirubrobacterales bacterium]HMT05577.1 ABC transporter substrate-binding protein [Solirubrobacterales bacterium]
MNFKTSWKKIMLLLAACMALTVGVAACGSSDDDSGDSGDSGDTTAKVQDATLVLDFIPGAVHAGIYEAMQKGYYEDNGINLKIIEPTSTADTLKLIDAGKAEFGIADGIDLATQIADGREAQGIMAIAQRPPGGLITLAEEGINDPKQLEGETVGVTGVPSDNAILDTIMADAGGSSDNVDVVTIGFNGVQSLESGKVKAFTGFIPADGVQVEADGYETKSFPLDEYGGPSYPGLVVFSTEPKIGEEPDLMQGFVDATVKGYQDALDDPAAAIDSLISQTQGIDKQLATESFDAWIPLFGPADTFGQFNKENLESLSTFMVDNGLADEPISPDRYATTQFTQPKE